MLPAEARRFSSRQGQHMTKPLCPLCTEAFGRLQRIRCKSVFAKFRSISLNFNLLKTVTLNTINSRFGLRSGVLKGAAFSLALAVLWLFPRAIPDL